MVDKLQFVKVKTRQITLYFVTKYAFMNTIKKLVIKKEIKKVA